MRIAEDIHTIGVTDCLEELESAYESIISSIRSLYEKGVFLSEENMNSIVDRANVLANYNIARIADKIFSLYKEGGISDIAVQQELVRCINSLKNNEDKETESYLIKSLFKESLIS